MLDTFDEMVSLVERYPSQTKFIERMLVLDVNYGSQQHQLDYLERMEELQCRQSCAKEHEHAASCYSDQVLKAVVAWQVNRRRATR